MKQRNAVAVPLHDGVPRLERLTNPDGAQLGEACARREAQVSQIVARYNVLRSQTEMPYRKNLVSVQALALSEDMERERRRVGAEREVATNRARTVRERAHKLGLPARILNDRQESDEGTALMLAAKREHDRLAGHQTAEEAI
jgi:hypothetical protein